MKLVNETHWSTADLKRFLIAGLKSKGASTNKTIRVRYGKGHAHGGCALLGKTRSGYVREASWIQLTLPGPKYIESWKKLGPSLSLARPRAPLIDYLKLAQVFEHEIDHNLGLNHGDMIDWWTLKPTWQDGLTIKWDPPKAPLKPTTDEKRAARLANARDRLKLAETRLKRAETIAKKWRARVRRLEKTK